MKNHLIAIVGGILLTGAGLKMASDGMFGAQVQKLARYITAGYGSV